MASGYEYHEPCRTDILPGWSVVNPGNAAASGGADSEFSPPNAGFWLSQKFWSGTWIRTEQTRKNNSKSPRTKQKFKALVQNIKTSEHTTLIKKMLSLWFSGRFGRFACLECLWLFTVFFGHLRWFATLSQKTGSMTKLLADWRSRVQGDIEVSSDVLNSCFAEVWQS